MLLTDIPSSPMPAKVSSKPVSGKKKKKNPLVESPILPVKKKQFARQRKHYIIKEKKKRRDMQYTTRIVTKTVRLSTVQYTPGRPPAVSEQTRERNM